MSLRLRLGLLGCILLILTVVGGHRINEPFTGHNEWNHGMKARFGRNHIRFGIETTKAMPLDVTGPSLRPFGEWSRYFNMHHPPLPMLITAASMFVFGDHEYSVRLVTLIFMLASVILFHLFMLRLMEPGWAMLATAFYALTPMMLYQAAATHHPIQTVCFCLAAFLFLQAYFDKGRRRDLILGITWTVAACMTDWPGYYIAAGMFMFTLFFDRKRLWVGFLLVGINFMVFGLHVFIAYLLDPGNSSVIRSLFSMGATNAGASISLWNYLNSEIGELRFYYSPVILMGLFLWAISVFWERPGIKAAWVATLVFLGLDQVLFSPFCYWHDFYSIPLGPFLCAGAALGCRFAWRRLFVRNRIITYVISGCLVLFFAWNSWGWTARLIRKGSPTHELAYVVAERVRDATLPDDRILIHLDWGDQILQYYLDRFARYYFPSRCYWYDSYVDPEPFPMKSGGLPDWVEKNGSSYDYLVIVTDDLVEIKGGGISLKSATEMGCLNRRHSLIQRLISRYPVRDLEGILLFCIKKK